MGTGKIKDNYKFYKGYEEEPEIRISTPDKKIEILHIWDGFFCDIFREPPLDGLGWHGFTRDFHQFEGVFSDDEFARITNLQEYLEDLKYYENKKFKYKQTREVYELLCSWFEDVIKKGYTEVITEIP